jgi:hypothetical protein
MSVDLTTAKAVSDGLQNQLDDLKTRGQRKRVTLDPSQTFADIFYQEREGGRFLGYSPKPSPMKCLEWLASKQAH